MSDNKLTLLKVIAISVATTAAISSIFGLAGSTVIGSFWGWFWITFAFQVILFAVTNSYFLQKDATVLRQIEDTALEQLSVFTIKMNCAYCSQPNTLPIQLTQKNTFFCESCNQVNGVSINFLATTLTTPIEDLGFPKLNSSKTNSNKTS